MVDISILEKDYGLTQEFFREALGGDLSKKSPTNTNPSSEETPEQKNHSNRLALQRRIKSRIQEGMNRNFDTYRVNYALDLAWDIPFKQINPTLVQSLIGKKQPEIESQLASWGIEGLLESAIDPKTGSPTAEKIINLPIFFNIYVPLVRAYVTIRWAKICNDRRLTPFFKFEPAKLTMLDRTKCEVITDRIQAMSTQFNYFETMKQGVLKMLHYSRCMQFIREEWYTEKQEVMVQSFDSTGKPELKDGKPVFKKEEQIVKEGLRYDHPHPSRTYRDLNHPAYTFNTDTGAEFAGYWRIVRYRDIAGNPAFYGTGEVSLSEVDIIASHQTFFQTAYNGCIMSYPIVQGAVAAEGDREAKVAQNFYGTEHADTGVVITQHFEKVIPSRDGLINPSFNNGKGYDHPVWFRFVVAGTSGNIIYAAPLPDTPVTTAGYDADESRAENPSMSLEILPFQDQFGNILSQLLLAMKQNLANLTLVDTDQVEKGTIDKIKNLGERFFRSLNFQGFSGTTAKRAQHQIPAAIQSWKFPQMNVQEIISCMKVILDTLERILVMSAQEVGQAASHEQSREEIRNIAQTGSARQAFTSIPVDAQRDAWKRQLYSYTMTFGKEEFYAQIPCDRSITVEQLNAWGFTTGESKPHSEDKFHRVKVKKEATAIPLHAFASTRDGDDRANDTQTAQVLSTLVRDLTANPMTARAIGPEQAIMFANLIAQYAGLPRDFKIRSLIKDSDMSAEAQGAEEQKRQAEAQAMMQAISKQVLAQVGEQVQGIEEGVKTAIEKTQDGLAKSLDTQMREIVSEIQTLSNQGKLNAGHISTLFSALKIPEPQSPSHDNNFEVTPARR